MEDITLDTYKRYIEEINNFIIDRYGKNTSDSELAFYAYKSYAKNFFSVPEELKNKNSRNYDRISNEEFSLILDYLKKKNETVIYLIVRLQGEYNLGPHQVVPNPDIAEPLKKENILNGRFLDVPTRRGKRVKAKLSDGVLAELTTYINSHNSEYLFPINTKRKALTYVTYWRRLKKIILPELFNQGYIDPRKKITPWSFKGAGIRVLGNINHGDVERIA